MSDVNGQGEVDIIPGVVAQTNDVEAEKQVRGVITLLTAKAPNVYVGSNRSDLQCAINERLTKKARQPKLMNKDRTRFMSVVQALCGDLGNRKKQKAQAASISSNFSPGLLIGRWARGTSNYPLEKGGTQLMITNHY